MTLAHCAKSLKRKKNIFSAKIVVNERYARNFIPGLILRKAFKRGLANQQISPPTSGTKIAQFG